MKKDSLSIRGKYIILFIALLLTACNPDDNRGVSQTDTAKSQIISSKTDGIIPKPTLPEYQKRTITAATRNLAPTMDASILNTLSGEEFQDQKTILFTISPGISQWMNISYIRVDGLTTSCITCGISDTLERRGVVAPVFYGPVWSPSSMTYAYIYSDMHKSSIYINRKENEDIELLSSEKENYGDLDWSPDGNYLAFSTSPAYGLLELSICYMEVNLSNPELAQKHCINPKKGNINPAWSPDGKSIVFSGGEGTNPPYDLPTDLFRWDLETQEITQITDTAESEILPKWSPDGSHFAYIIMTAGGEDYALWIMNANGTEKRRVGGSEAIFDYDWSPDGKQIAIAQFSPAERASCDIDCLPYTFLKIINLETEEIRILTDGMEWIGDISWRPKE